MPEIIVNDVPIEFPFKPYEVQKNYMQKLIECLQKKNNGVLESPTGTGKTLCLLCASLAWLQLKKAEHSAKNLSNACDPNEKSEFLEQINSQLESAVGGMWKQGRIFPKIIYSSRTHSQLSQAVNELKQTSYRHMKVSILGSRDQMCIHPEVSTELDNNNKVQMCQARVKGRNCYFYNQVEHKKLEPELRENILDLEDLVKLGKKRTFCPYYMARELKQDADIIFMPYNYLLDPKTRKAHGIDLTNSIVIFDEAHNVEKVCEESASLQIRSTDLALCIDEITSVMKKLQDIAESSLSTAENCLLPEDFSIEDLYILKTIFLELEKALDEINLPGEASGGGGVTYPGGFMFDLLQKADITPSKKEVILDVLDKLIQYLTTNSSSPFQRKGAGLQKFSELIKTVFSIESFSAAHMEFVKQCYKVHVNVEEKKFAEKGWKVVPKSSLGSKAGKTLSYWCFNPGFGMKELLQQGIHSVILTSGTLSPLESFTSELQIPFEIQLENPHIINSSQVWVGVIRRGPDSVILNSSYQNRSKPEYIKSLGLTIFNLARIIPGGLLVFFPSYPIMKSCQEFWQDCGTWHSINKCKTIFVEPRTKDGFHSAMNEFYEKVKDPQLKGACFFAVCRGKVSEGLDFSDSNGRAVIITGLPYPPFKDPRVMLKQKYLDEIRVKNKKGLTGSSWYRLEASRAVNQAIGRVIRHKDDFGAIILCDQRFGDESFKKELSSWVRPYVKIHEKFSSTVQELIQFFRITKNMFPEQSRSKNRIPEVSKNQKSTNIENKTIKIAYEGTEEPENYYKKPSGPFVSAFGQLNSRPVSSRTSDSVNSLKNGENSQNSNLCITTFESFDLEYKDTSSNVLSTSNKENGHVGNCSTKTALQNGENCCDNLAGPSKLFNAIDSGSGNLGTDSGLFGALDAGSSVLDFNNLSSPSETFSLNFNEVRNSERIGDKNRNYCKNSDSRTGLSDLSAPKKKKIKIISNLEKNLNDVENNSEKVTCYKSKLDPTKIDKSKFDPTKTDKSEFDPTKTDKLYFDRNKNTDFENKPNNSDVNGRKTDTKDEGKKDSTTSGNEDKTIKTAKYLREVKNALSKEEYSKFSSAVKTYKITSDVDRIIASVLELFGVDRNRHVLLKKFSLFLKPDHRCQLESTYQDLVSL